MENYNDTNDTTRDDSGAPVNKSEKATAVRFERTVDKAEEELVARLVLGEESAFEEIVARYSSGMLRLAQSFVPDRSVAEEVVQETWLAVLRGITKFEGRSSLKTWLFRILSNRAKSRGMRESRTVPMSYLEGSDGATQTNTLETGVLSWTGTWRSPLSWWSDHTPEQFVLNKELQKQIIETIDSLPDKQRTVMRLREVEGWLSNEVCEELNISETYQRVLLHRGRMRLREAMAA